MLNKEKIGVVISKKLQKTIIINIQSRFPHLKYKKIILKQKHYFVHDENNICNCGDIILFKEVAPISFYKKWTLKKIIKIYNY